MTPVARFKDLCVDARNVEALAAWWMAVLAYDRSPRVVPGVAPPVLIEDPHGVGPPIWFCPVPEDKVVKNRVHFDVWGDTHALLSRGATLVRARDHEIRWDVLADIEGNEFCVFSEPPVAP